MLWGLVKQGLKCEGSVAWLASLVVDSDVSVADDALFEQGSNDSVFTFIIDFGR